MDRKPEFVVKMIINFILMLFLFYFVLNTFLYDWTGTLHPKGTGYRLDFLLDNMIPFVPSMDLFYDFLFYPMAIATMLFFGFIEARKGPALGWSLVLINAIAILVYIVFPVSTYWWRLDLNLQLTGDFWNDAVYQIYNTDTSFNCFPSLHAAVSTICFYAWYRYAKLKPGKITKVLAVVTFAIATGVILSTLFVKQHYIVDEIAGIVLAWAVGKLFFNKMWKKFEEKPSP
jgi:membrane-associated phospholipid phosphatase